MNNITQTSIYKKINTIYGNIPKNISSINFQDYIIPQNFYSSTIEKFKDYRFILAQTVYDHVKAGLIKPILLAEGYDIKHKGLINKFPPNWWVFNIIENNSSKNLLTLVDISMKSKYIRNKLDSTVESCKIDNNDLYAFMEIGFISRFVKKKDNVISNSKNLLKELATAYGVLLAKVIDQKLSISADRDDFSILLFLCICLFYESMAELSKSKAIEKARQMRFLFKNTIDSKCKYLSVGDELNMQYDEKEALNGIYPIDKFVKAVKNEFPSLNGKFEYRDILLWWTSLYSSNSISSIESFQDFLIMLTSVELKCNFYNDLVISTSVKNQLPEIKKLILSML